MNVSNESYLAENLERLGSNALNREQESEIAAAFLKFAVVTKELSALMRNMVIPFIILMEINIVLI